MRAWTGGCGSPAASCSGAACVCPGGATSETACTDGRDDDCDGGTDCADPDCNAISCGSGGRVCSGGVCSCPGGEPAETMCSDARDNDCDSDVDCGDVDCTGRTCGTFGRVCTAGACLCPGGGTEVACTNGIDDDCSDVADDGIPAPAVLPLLTTGKTGSVTDLSWQPVPDATGYDVVKGDLHPLRTSNGDFAT